MVDIHQLNLPFHIVFEPLKTPPQVEDLDRFIIYFCNSLHDTFGRHFGHGGAAPILPFIFDKGHLQQQNNTFILTGMASKAGIVKLQAFDMPGIANNWHHLKNQFDSVKFFEGTSDEKDGIIYQLRETLEEKDKALKEKDKALKEMAEKNKALEKELEEFRKR